MPAKIPAINLLHEDESTHSPVGRMVAWITSYGRYIMVTTELIVLIAFASRFSLDRRLTDLNEEIVQKQEILEVNNFIEQDIRTAQDELKNIKQSITNQALPFDAVTNLHAILPAGVYLENLSVNQGKLTTNIVALTTRGFTDLLGNIANTALFTNVDIGTISKLPLSGIRFPLTATLAIKPQSTALKQ